jgi:hypothetical protein
VKKLFKFALILFSAFLAISVISGIYQGITGKDLSPKNYSYEVGYEAGFSGVVGRAYVGGLGSNSKAICQSLVEISQAGLPNDGINWSSIKIEDFVEGCLEGTREAHPGASWVS